METGTFYFAFAFVSLLPVDFSLLVCCPSNLNICIFILYFGINFHIQY